MLGEGKLPYVVEVVNDPESFPGGLVRDFSVRMVRKMTARAQGASYVTERFLQEKYPSRRRLGDESGFESFYSSIDLDERTVRSEPRGFDRSGPLRVVHVANAINDDTKGLSTLLKAAAKTVEGGLDVRLTCVGDGAALDDYKRMAEELGIKDRVQFVGRLTGQKAIFEVLDRNDMLVLPTRMEGLPRTVIESMARGLPCLSTPVAGIPELLETKYLFQPDDYEGFAEEILRLASCPEELRGMGARNIEKAREYTSDKLGRRRTAFYEQLRDCAVKR